MPTVRYTGGGRYRVGGHNFGPGDTRDVDDELAEHLDGVDEFDILGEYEVSDGSDESEESGGSDESDDTDETDADTAIADGDAEGFVDRTPVSDVAEDIRNGIVDEVLDEIEAAEENNRDRTTVYETIEARRDELEG